MRAEVPVRQISKTDQTTGVRGSIEKGGNSRTDAAPVPQTSTIRIAMQAKGMSILQITFGIDDVAAKDLQLPEYLRACWLMSRLHPLGVFKYRSNSDAI